MLELFIYFVSFVLYQWLSRKLSQYFIWELHLSAVRISFADSLVSFRIRSFVSAFQGSNLFNLFEFLIVNDE